MGRILVVDDERSVLQAFQELLSGFGHEVVPRSNGMSAVEYAVRNPPDVVVTDLCMPGISGLETFAKIREINPRIPVIIMTGQGSMETAIEATKQGAFDYQLKPFEPECMVSAIEKAIECVRLMQRSVELDPCNLQAHSDAIIGSSNAMQEVFKAIGRVAPTDASVLIRGESGSGKELVARAIYQHSRRSELPMLVVNCAAIPESLLESELFGHERGAFTGAHGRRIGKFEQANQGTIFLDEIGDISPPVQVKMLRLLQQKTFERVGGTETVRANVRIIAATNRNLEQAITDGVFREDLFHRLNVVTVRIPPLRERRDDIPRLVNYFLDRYSGELNLEKPLVSDDAARLLAEYDWPGNVRELEHCIYRVLIFTGGYPIQSEDVQRSLGTAEIGEKVATGARDQSILDLVDSYFAAGTCGSLHERVLGDVERLLIIHALRRVNGNQTHAAEILGISRPTLHARIRRYGIECFG